MIGQNPFTEEGRTRFRNFERRLVGYLIISFVIGLLAGFGFFRLWTRANMQPLQKIYLKQYGLGSLKALVSGKAASKYLLLTCSVTGPNGQVAAGGVTDDQVHPVRDREGRPVRNENGFIFTWNMPRLGELSWRKVKVNDRQMVALLRDHHYEEESFFELLTPAAITGLFVFLAGAVGSIVFDQRLNKKYEEGKFQRGTRLIQPEKFKLETDSPGLGVPSLRIRKRGLSRLRRKEDRIYWLRVPREDEAAHTTLLGDTGTGKSQLIHLFLWQIAQRQPREPVIISDPAGEFVTSHFVAERGDVVLNPMDQRFPFWNPATEVKLKTDHDLIAESFFPGNEHSRNEFFIRAARDIFARLLSFRPAPEQLVKWLVDETEIDNRVRGTELAHKIASQAPQQRGGVLGTLSDAGKSLQLLPKSADCTADISLTEWATERRGWLFVTSSQDTRNQLRPLHTIFLDLIMKRLMSCDPSWSRQHPCWMIVDEAHALGRMPALSAALTEGRKFGLRIVIGTQNKSQFKEHYGEAATTMLSQSVTKITFRCNEPESARWISELIGEAEWEKPKIGTTASVADQGRDSLHYSNNDERKAVVSREEIMGLEKLHGYWKYRDMVVPFRFEARNWPKLAERFMPRTAMLAEANALKDGGPEAPASARESNASQPTYKFNTHVKPTQKEVKKEKETRGNESPPAIIQKTKEAPSISIDPVTEQLMPSDKEEPTGGIEPRSEERGEGADLEI